MITVTGCADIAIGNTPYEVLATAISKAKDGDVINVFANVTSSEAIVLNKNITLNGNGYTLTSTELVLSILIMKEMLLLRI